MYYVILTRLSVLIIFLLQEYVKGLSNPEEIVRLRIPDALIECLWSKSADLERETAAIISFANDGKIVEISGGISRVTNAATSIEHMINMFIETQGLAGSELESDNAHDEQPVGLTLNSVNDNLHASKNTEIVADALTGQFCFRQQGNPDFPASSECTHANGDENSYPKQPNCTFINNNNNNNEPSSASSETTLNADLMEYGLKLGYTEEEVRSAMKKLGVETAVNKNELLHELIKASASAKQIGKTEDSKMENCSGYPRPLDASILRHVVVDGSNVAMR